jgi:hypothetical protein
VYGRVDCESTNENNHLKRNPRTADSAAIIVNLLTTVDWRVHSVSEMNDSAHPTEPGTPECNANSAGVYCQHEVVVPTLDLTGVTQAAMARQTGVSTSMISRLLSDDPEQRRQNPTLEVMVKLRAYLERETGEHVSLDALAKVFRG